MDKTRSGLIDGVLKLVLSHPMKLLAETTVNAMVRATEESRREAFTQFLLPFDIYTAENLRESPPIVVLLPQRSRRGKKVNWSTAKGTGDQHSGSNDGPVRPWEGNTEGSPSCAAISDRVLPSSLLRLHVRCCC
jgi:hypothetical protein